MSVFGNMAGNAVDLDVGEAVENVLVCDVDYAIGSAEKEHAATTEVWRPNFWRSSKLCPSVATVCPLPRIELSERSTSSLDHPQSPAVVPTLSPTRLSPGHIFFASSFRTQRQRNTLTQVCPFSFDLRDSMRRVAHERKLEELRLMQEKCLGLPFTFKANPVRRYKPLMKQSSRQLTVPRLPFSRGEPRM